MKSEIKGIKQSIISEIIKIILARKQAEKIVIFGSRANGSFKDVSDIDIAVFGKDWSSVDINMVKDRLDEEIDTPLKLDLLNFYDLNKKTLKQSILKDGVVVYERTEN